MADAERKAEELNKSFEANVKAIARYKDQGQNSEQVRQSVSQILSAYHDGGMSRGYHVNAELTEEASRKIREKFPNKVFTDSGKFFARIDYGEDWWNPEETDFVNFGPGARPKEDNVIEVLRLEKNPRGAHFASIPKEAVVLSPFDILGLRFEPDLGVPTTAQAQPPPKVN